MMAAPGPGSQVPSDLGGMGTGGSSWLQGSGLHVMCTRVVCIAAWTPGPLPLAVVWLPKVCVPRPIHPPPQTHTRHSPWPDSLLDARTVDTSSSKMRLLSPCTHPHWVFFHVSANVWGASGKSFPFPWHVSDSYGITLWGLGQCLGPFSWESGGRGPLAGPHLQSAASGSGTHFLHPVTLLVSLIQQPLLSVLYISPDRRAHV